MTLIAKSRSAKGPLKMHDIARLAGVSTATVSRTLHNSALVDPETARRIKKIVSECNYVPNFTGTALKSGRSGIYGLIVPDILNGFFADFVKQFERILVNRDQEMLLAITDHSAEEMQRCMRRMLMRGAEGLIVLESEIETRAYETMLHNQIPLVTLNRLKTEPGVSDVAVETTSGMKEAIGHLQSLGHSRIGFLGGRPHQAIADAREESFREAMARCGVAVDEDALRAANFTLEGGHHAMRSLLREAKCPTAVLCANDLSAVGALNAVRERGLAAGRDISIVGLDDIDICTIVDPPLTTLHLSRKKLAELYMEALSNLVRAPHEPGEQLSIAVQLVVRQSTGPAPAARRRRAAK